MIIRVTFDDKGAAAGFFPEDIWPVGYPDGAVEITREQYEDLLEYQGLRRWDGKKIIKIEPPSPPLSPLTARQLRLGLIANGISLSQVEVAISSIDDETAKVEWEYASQFERDHHLIEQVGAALDLTPEQIDAMWEEALSL